MRFTCRRNDIQKTVQAVSGVVASKGVHPVYESVSIVAGPDSLTFLATDLEIGMKVRVPTGDGVEVQEPGNAVVPAHRLAAICRELPDADVTFEWDEEKRESTITAGPARFALAGQSPEDFPEIPDVGTEAGVTLEGSALQHMIRRTAFAAAKERMRFALNGVLFHVSGESIDMVATDGRRLAKDQAACTNPDGLEMDTIVPTKGLQQLQKVLGGDDVTVTLAVGNNHFSARTDNVIVVSRLVEGTFPNYRDVIPETTTRQADVPREAFTSALKRCSLVTTRDARSVKLRFHDAGLTLTSRSTEGSAEETIECEFGGEEEVIGFNPEFLLDVLPVLTGESLSFAWNGKSSPGKIVEGPYTYVVMPVSLE